MNEPIRENPLDRFPLIKRILNVESLADPVLQAVKTLETEREVTSFFAQYEAYRNELGMPPLDPQDVFENIMTAVRGKTGPLADYWKEEAVRILNGSAEEER